MLSASAGLVVASAYPIEPSLAMGLFVAWAVFASLRFGLALPAMLALLPVVGFAPFTGWLTFEELDLLILASAAGGYATFAFRTPPTDAGGSTSNGPRFSILAVTLIGLFLLSLSISLERGFASAGGLRFDWTQSYNEPLNSLRVYKPFVAAVLMAPLVLRELRIANGLGRIGLGITAALALCSLAVLQERWAFVSLLDFSSDYRVTGPFWEMHVGGVALEGFLALAIPFAVREALRRPRDQPGHLQAVAVGAVLALAAYAAFVTFSRGLFLALPVSLAVLALLLVRQRVGVSRGALWSVLAKTAALVLVAGLVASVVFRHGGYRTLLAMLGVLLSTAPVDASLRRITTSSVLPIAVATLVSGTVAFALSILLPKGPYLAYALLFAITVATAVRAQRLPGGTLSGIVVASWLALAATACLVARYWGGGQAERDSAIVAAGLVVLGFAASRSRESIWPVKPHERLVTAGLVVLVMGSVAVLNAGQFVGERFTSSGGDLAVRLAHWRAAIDRLGGPGDWAFGKGLGRYPATSLFEPMDIPPPGSYTYTRRAGESFVALSVPQLPYAGFDQFFRFSQRVFVRPRTPYRVIAQVRSSLANSVHFEMCTKHLLYWDNCTQGDLKVEARSTGWQRVETMLDTTAFGASPWYAPKPVFFAIAAERSDTVLEIHGVHLVGPDGVDLLANGDFSDRTARWFSSSDKYHLPWHIENMLLDVLFGQGIVGVVLFVLLIGGALLRTTVGRAFRHPDAPYVAAALVAALVVGLFDTLIDVPRVTFLFYLVALTGFMLRSPRGSTASSNTAPPKPVAPAPRVDDEAAARALRRQKAFGERVQR